MSINKLAGKLVVRMLNGQKILSPSLIRLGTAAVASHYFRNVQNNTTTNTNISYPPFVEPPEVKAALREVQVQSEQVYRLRKEMNQCWWESRRLASYIRRRHFVLSLRHTLDRSVSRIVALGIGLTLGTTACVAMHALFGAPIAYVLVTAVGVAMSAAMFALLAFSPKDGTLRASIDEFMRAHRECSLNQQYLGKQLGRHSERLDKARAHYDSELAKAKAAHQQRIRESRLYYLQNCQWRMMTGSVFEQFLSEVFQERGYTVRLTGKTGDQGVDLVITRNGVSIAIQAKGFPSTKVSNTAVQEAHTGMTHYKCDAAAVVTNSQFTRSAQALARSVGCRLIDGDQIPQLIDGRISV